MRMQKLSNDVMCPAVELIQSLLLGVKELVRDTKTTALAEPQ